MKKKMFLVGFCVLMISMVMYGTVGVSASTTRSSASFILSKEDQTQKN